MEKNYFWHLLISEIKFSSPEEIKLVLQMITFMIPVILQQIFSVHLENWPFVLSHNAM